VALRRSRGPRPGPVTVGLGAFALVTTGAVVIIEFGRVWRRGSAPLPAEADDPIRAAAEAAAETAEVARVGYREGSRRENSLFNLLGSFVITFITTRMVATLLRGRKSVGPFRNLTVGRRHIHHFVPGIVLAFGAGGAAIVSRNQDLEPWLALPFGAGMGLTLDESALLLELDDVYWSEEGILSVQITLAVTALLASMALVIRVFRRGEREVLEAAGDDGPPPR
jgi:hypothetical protein